MSGPDTHIKQDLCASDSLPFFFFLVAGILAFFHPTILSGFSLMQTDVGDTRFNNYILEHGFQWIMGNPFHKSFWDAPLFFPAQNTVAYSDVLLGAAPPYWLFRLAGFLPDTAFQLWMLCMGILNFTVAFVTMRHEVGLSALASAGGAYLFAFAALRLNQLSHQQLLPQFFSMLAVYCVIMIVRNAQSAESAVRWKIRGWIVLLVACVVLQLYAGFYLGYFIGLGLATVLGVALFFRQGRAVIGTVVRRYTVTIALVAAIAIMPLMWMGNHYLMAKKEVGVREWAAVSSMVPQAVSWVNVGPENWLYAWTRHFLPISALRPDWEHRLGLGFVTLVITGIGLVKMARNRWGLIALIACLAIGLFAFTYSRNFVPWWLAFKILPGASAIRAVTRIALLLLIVFSFGLAFFLDSVKNRKIALALLVLVCLEQAGTSPSYSKQRIRSDVISLASQIPAGTTAFYYNPCLLPGDKAREWDDLYYKHQLDAMHASLKVGIPTVNGYSGNSPAGWGKLDKNVIRSRSDEERLGSALDTWLGAHGMPRDSIARVGNTNCCKAGFSMSNCEGDRGSLAESSDRGSR
jgi:hypothetical protein